MLGSVKMETHDLAEWNSYYSEPAEVGVWASWPPGIAVAPSPGRGAGSRLQWFLAGSGSFKASRFVQGVWGRGVQGRL